MQKLMIFDVDDTLLKLRNDESDAYVKAFEICCGITGVNDDWPSYQIGSDVGIAMKIVETHIGRPAEENELREIRETFASLLLNVVPEPLPGAQAMLETLVERYDVDLALATGNFERVAQLRLGQAGMMDHFRCGGFAEHGNGKTEILGKALEQCRRVWPEFDVYADVIYLGDSLSDAVAAQKHGTHFIGITSEVNKFAGLPTDYIYSDYRDIDGFLGSLERIWKLEQ